MLNMSGSVKEGSEDEVANRRHKIMAQMSQSLNTWMQEVQELMLPEFDQDEVRQFLDQLYQRFWETYFDLASVKDVAQTLGIGIPWKPFDEELRPEFKVETGFGSIDLEREAFGEEIATSCSRRNANRKRNPEPDAKKSKHESLENTSLILTEAQQNCLKVFQNGRGIIPVQIYSEDPLKRTNHLPSVLIGLNDVRAKPLAWSNPSPIDIPNQFQSAFDSFRNIFGFSKLDLLTSPNLCKKFAINTKAKKKKMSDECFKKFNGKSSDVLESELQFVNMQITDFKFQSQSSSTLAAAVNCLNEGGEVNLEIQRSLENFNSLAVVSLDKNAVGGKLYAVHFPVEEKRSEVAGKCLDILFAVWSTVDPNHCQDIVNQWEEVVGVQITKETISSLLNEYASEKYCSECGILFALETKKDKHKYKTHMESHERERFSCNCNLSFSDATEKKKHIMLQHSDGKYTKCERCAFIGTLQQVSTHLQINHKPYICDICGKKVPTKGALCVHLLDHKLYRCGICGMEITGRHKYTRHVDTNHTGLWPCEVCGMTFKSKSYMVKHAAIMHQADDAKPFRCEDCGKGFVTSNSLKTHKMNVHIKSRPYVCRYGCGAAYNDSSNRGHHERKKHGGNYDPTKLQQQLPQMI